jgi:hypothetical protein
MSNTLNDVTESATSMSRDVKDSVVEFGRAAARKIDTAREHSGEVLREVASSLRQASARMDVLAGSAASSLDTAAEAVRDVNLQRFGAGIKRFGQRNITATVLVAIAAGFFVASALHRGKTVA